MMLNYSKGGAGTVGKLSAAVALALGLFLSGCGTGPRVAAKPNAAAAAAPATQQEVAGMLHVCSSCHGFDGRSISPTFPRLAGQQKAYLIAQLKAFRDKTRADPHARTYMWGMTRHLDNAMIDKIAAFYAAQPPVAGTHATSPEIAAGARIFANGLPAQHVLACRLCHGPTAAGNGPIPRLAGQHRAYLARQLRAFASKARANPIMHQMSKNLTPQQISEVTAFLRTQ
jgi:cytochrome c553